MASNADWKNIYAPASSTYYYILSIYWEEQNYSIDNNTSYIWGRARLESKGIGFTGNGISCLYLYWHDNHTNTDTVINSIIPGSMGTNDTFDVTGGMNVAHNDDGTLSGYAYAYWWKKSNNSYVPESNTIATGWTALTNIPRANTVSATSGYIGSDITVSIGKKSDSFTTTLTYSFGAKSGTIATRTPYGSVPFPIPTTFYEEIPNSSRGTGVIYAYTYNGNTHIGTNSTYFYVDANPNEASPSVKITNVIDTNDKTKKLTGDDTKLVRYCSTALVSTARETKYSSSVRNLYINNVDVGTSTTTRSIANIDTNTFNATVYDTRGFYANTTPVVKDEDHYIEYIPLTLSIKKLERHTPLDNQVLLEYEGNYFNNTFGAKDNSLVVRWKYREVGTEEYSNWTVLSPTIEGNTYSQQLLLDYNPSTTPSSNNDNNEDVDPTRIDDEDVILYDENGNPYIPDDGEPIDETEDEPDDEPTSDTSLYSTTGTTVFDYEKSYEFVIEALDKINNNGEVVVIQVISQGIPVYWWDKNSFTSEVDFFLKGKNIIDIIHPVGSIYLTLDNTNPSTLFGGTWEQISQGRTLVGAGAPQVNADNEFGFISSDQLSWNFTPGNTAGSYNHYHTLSDNGYAKMASHGATNTIAVRELSVPGYTATYSNGTNSGNSINNTDYYGVALGGTSDAQWSIQPYFVVYIWKRTA